MMFFNIFINITNKKTELRIYNNLKGMNMLRTSLNFIYNYPSTLLIFIAALVLLFVLIYLFGYKIGFLKQNIIWNKKLPFIREDAVKRSRAVLSGQFSEQLAPYLPDFKYNPSDCKFIGAPIDLIIFNGMNEKNIQEVVFVEIKSGGSNLSKQERLLKEAILSGNVRWEEYRIPENLTSSQ